MAEAAKAARARATAAAKAATAALSALSAAKAAYKAAAADLDQAEAEARWSNLICSHRADVLAIFRNDTARRVKTYPRARQKVCAANVRREGEPIFG